jgi:hypothetical protein
MTRFLIMLSALAWSLAGVGCATGGGGIPGDEAYRGHLVAGLVRPAGSASPQAIQQRLRRGIEAADIFASIALLDSRHQNNEAEVIILPTVLGSEPASGRFDRLTLAVRSYRKSTGAVGLEKTYKGRRSGRGDAFDDVLRGVVRDLKRRYRKPPVF